MRNIIFALLILVFPCVSGALEQTKTGFIYPIGTSEFPPTGGTWLGRDAAHDNDSYHYFDGLYHIGVDMVTGDFNAPVYAIADGTIFFRDCDQEKKNWGSGNCALFIRHKTSTGQVFTGLYGHLRMTTIPDGNDVVAGQVIGKTGSFTGPESNAHLHFGVRLGDSLSPSPWGIMPNSSWTTPCEDNVQCTNGFINPIAFIQNNAPSLKRKMSHSGTVYWYPPVDFCTNANQWYRMTPSGPVAADISICAEVPPMCPFDNQ